MPDAPGWVVVVNAALAATARTLLSLRPDERGTKKLLAECGDQRGCVRYRCDERHARRFKTAELLAWWPEVRSPASQEEIVDVRVEWQ